MHVTFVNVWVKKDFIKDFIEATILNHIESVKEPGNLRFDILQDPNDPCRFVLYEAYESESAAINHKDTQHYLTWREKVSPWMEKPREGHKYKIIFPTDKNLW